jgi:hypothetical protein
MERGDGLVLKLTKSVYGLKQAPRYFFEHLSKKMALCGLKQSDKDPCLFIGVKVCHCSCLRRRCVVLLQV